MFTDLLPMTAAVEDGGGGERRDGECSGGGFNCSSCCWILIWIYGDVRSQIWVHVQDHLGSCFFIELKLINLFFIYSNGDVAFIFVILVATSVLSAPTMNTICHIGIFW